MLTERRIAGLCAIVGIALAVRLWVVFSPVALPPLGQLLVQTAQGIIGAAIAAAVACLAWSRMPDRPAAGWLAAAFAAIYPPHVWLATAPSAGLWLALAITALLIRWQRGWAMRLAMFSAALALAVVPPMTTHRMQTGSWSPVVATTENLDDAGEGDTDRVVERLLSLKDFALFSGEGPWAADRFCRLAAVALLVMSGIGLALSCRQWRALGPTYLLFLATASLVGLGYATPSLRVVVEPLIFLWAAWALVPTLTRKAPPTFVRVYRPGEQPHDPFEPHVLPGPHYPPPERRRAG
jgi:hypothetical protein